jgi:hypothetical protein
VWSGSPANEYSACLSLLSYGADVVHHLVVLRQGSLRVTHRLEAHLRVLRRHAGPLLVRCAYRSRGCSPLDFNHLREQELPLEEGHPQVSCVFLQKKDSK